MSASAGPRRRPPAVFLLGPTAAGKTSLAADLAATGPLGIVNVDSALVYRGLNIGAARPDAATLARAPHRLIGMVDPAEAYSAGRFREDALAAMADIRRDGRVPLLVGGTMMYFRALAEGLGSMPPADPEVRRQLEHEAGERGLAALHAELAAVDPDAGRRIHPNDPQRIQRALEVWRITGRPISEARTQVEPLPWRVLRLAVAPADRAILHRRIERRFHAMLDAGLVEEVAALRDRPDLHRDLPAMRAVGYRQVWRYLDGEYDHAEMTERAIVATRQLAKRQLTWLRGESDVEWFDSETVTTDDLRARIKAFLDGEPSSASSS